MKKRILVLGLCFSVTIWAADFPKLKGWKPASEVVVYHPGNLWEYINGAAEQFLSFGFQELMYRDLSRKDLVVTVHIYDMGGPLNAYGIYTAERSDETVRHAIGGEAVVLPPYQCLLLKGAYYVKIDAYEGEISEETGLDLVTVVANALPGQDGFPEELRRLPEKDKIEGTERYARESYLGLGELQGCVYAKYRSEGTEFQRFFIGSGSEFTAENAEEVLGEKWKPRKWKGQSVLSREVPYRGIVGLMLTGEGWVGVADCKSEKEMLKRLEIWLR